jgi:hypothetical protein
MAKWINPTRLIAAPDQFSVTQFRIALEDYRTRVGHATNAQIRNALAKVVRELEKALADKGS